MSLTRFGLDDLLTCTRASSALIQNSAGVYSSVGNNVLRRSFEGGSFCLLAEEARTNSLPRNDFSGGTAGVIGSGGAFPTGVTFNNTIGSGAVMTVDFGTEFGLDYMDVRWQGTSTADGQVGRVNFNLASSVPAVMGQTWTASCFSRLISGTFPSGGGNAFRLNINERDGETIVQGGVSTVASPTATLARTSATRTLTNATTDNITAALEVRVDNAVSVDVTIRYYAPQLEQGAFATSPIITSGSAVTRQADRVKLNDGLLAQVYGGGPVSVLTEFEMEYVAGGSGSPRVWQMDDGTSDNRIMVSVVEGSDASRVQAVSDGTSSYLTDEAYASGSALKVASRFQAGDYAASRNGASVTTGSDAGFPTGLINLGIGNWGFSTASGPARLLRLRKFILYPAALTNAELEALSA